MPKTIFYIPINPDGSFWNEGFHGYVKDNKLDLTLHVSLLFQPEAYQKVISDTFFQDYNNQFIDIVIQRLLEAVRTSPGATTLHCECKDMSIPTTLHLYFYSDDICFSVKIQEYGIISIVIHDEHQDFGEYHYQGSIPYLKQIKILDGLIEIFHAQA